MNYTVILLDLNYTLVTNSTVKVSPFTKQIEGEEYSSELVKYLGDASVFLITARPVKYKYQTLNNIAKKIQWQPHYSYFNFTKFTPPAFKELVIRKFILPRYKPDELLAIESNPRTRAMYNRHNIKAISAEQFLKEKKEL